MHALSDPPLVCTMTEDSLWWLAFLARPKWGLARVLRGVEPAGSPQVAWDRWFLREPSEAVAGRDTARGWLEAARFKGMHVYTFHQPQWGVRWAGNRALVVDDIHGNAGAGRGCLVASHG